MPTLDQKYYDTVAKMLLAGEDLHELHAFRPLLYPMFLAFFYKLGGNWGVDLALLVQHLLGIATGLLVALLGARLFRHRLAGVVGGALFLLAPLPLCFEGELLIEPSYTFLICLGLLLHLHTATVRGWRSALLWLLCGGDDRPGFASAGKHPRVPRGLSAVCRVALVAHAGTRRSAALAGIGRRAGDDDSVGNH